jgi:ABC-type sulfate transport system substrate-binding protein
MTTRRSILSLAFAATVAAGLAGVNTAAHADTKLLNVSDDPTREF